MRRLMLLGVLVGGVLGGCSGSIRSDVSSIPAPSLVRFLPRGYRVMKTYRADLTGGVVRDVIVTSEDLDANPPQTGEDLQVLSWNPGTRRWRLTFDGRSTMQPNVVSGPQDGNDGPGDPYGVLRSGTFPVLADIDNEWALLGRVAFAPLLGGDRDDLVFGGGVSWGGPGFIAVVSFQSGMGKIIYVWEDAPGVSWHLSHNVIDAESSVPGDGMTQWPVRTYRFALAARAGRIVEVSDDRPFLGIVVRLPYTPDKAVVVRTIPHGPSAGLLRPGDVILSVENAQRMRYFPAQNGRAQVLGPGPRSTLKYDVDFSIDSLKAGQTVRLLIQRGNKRLTVRVKLGSLMSPAASAISTPLANEVAF